MNLGMRVGHSFYSFQDSVCTPDFHYCSFAEVCVASMIF